jgi:hypothetical protein
MRTHFCLCVYMCTPLTTFECLNQSLLNLVCIVNPRYNALIRVEGTKCPLSPICSIMSLKYTMGYIANTRNKHRNTIQLYKYFYVGGSPLF